MVKKKLVFTPLLTEAVEYVRQHHTETRKGTSIPYLAHLLGVAALVMAEADGAIPVTEEMIVAALLHDVAEDHGGLPRLREVQAFFGAEVARMVEGLSDSLSENSQQKDSWEERKRAYLERLRMEPDPVLLISVADKLYNAKSILDDYREVGDAVWLRFKRGAREQLWYFDALQTIFRERIQSRNLDEFERVLEDLKRLTGACPETSQM
jgi:(p)ppGpp synthase/HD superfamily hydrolase